MRMDACGCVVCVESNSEKVGNGELAEGCSWESYIHPMSWQIEKEPDKRI